MPVPGENIRSWSATAASNGTADSSINWAEGQARASVNNSARSEMAAIAKWRDLLNGSITTAGTANAQTFLSGMNYTVTPETGLCCKLKIGAALTNTGATTLNMDTLGDVAILGNTGLAFIGGELTAGSYADFLWDGTNWRLLSASAGVFSTGDIKTTLKTVADTGWVLFNDGTIGDATSNATTRANADTSQLFVLLYGYSDTDCPLLTSAGAATTRGAQGAAATAFGAHCQLSLPKVLGRALAVAGAGSGLTSRTLGSAAGAETVALSVGNLAPHQHSALNGINYMAYPGSGLGLQSGVDILVDNYGATASAGSGTPFGILPPSVFFNVMVKL